MISPLKRAAIVAALTPALLLQMAPAQAATPAAKAKPQVLTCKVTTPEGLSYTIIKAGKGERPNAESKVTVNYKGMLTADGSEFDSGKDAQFPVGGVIPGFAQGLQLMQPGGSYRLCIPSKLGYGEAGTGPIPANADLVFEVELLSFNNPPPKPVIPVAERTCSQTTASGLGFDPVSAGTGRKPTDADMALVDFTVFDGKTGIVQQKREWEKIPLSQTSPVFSESLKMMQTGSTYRFCMPKTAPTDPDSNIIVTLLDLRPAPSTE
ncbi:FKBP-type peptidyl-prolyl cis-trans isomerase [Sphingorhabdus sp.]|uniref:FKBP-type peptidyl-prolyl cis-trans isomerase n=1 Tax=Sphingorhabdus sp. TaxID=1902408 RepID=UPI0039830C7E